MKTQSASTGNLGMALVAAATGVLSFTALPFLIARTMTAVLEGAAAKIPASGNPLIATAPRIVIAFFPVWGGLSIAAGVALLLVAWAIHKGEAWARPAAIGLLAIPSITGAYYSGPVMYFGKSALPIFILVALLGLVPYFTILLWGKASAGEKIARFFVFLMLGVTAAWSFSNGGSSLRMFWARPEYYPLDASNTGFILGVPVIWAGVLATVISIPFLADKTRVGWRLSVVGLGIILVGSLILRVTHPGTKEFLIGIIMAVISLALLFIPAISRKLVEVKT
jgi:hypothetical protein